MIARCRECGSSEWTDSGTCHVCKTFPTLGYQIADWIELRCAIPDRELAGSPFLLTDEQLRFLLWFYRLDPVTGKFVYYRGGQIVRSQKWGKSPMAAAIICAEAEGPVRFSYWNEKGQPEGGPVPTPLIQVHALSEEQTQNVYSALLPMIELGALGSEIEDTGLGRINLPHGGRIEPVTASARSRLGQRITFAVQDQTESWVKSNGGRTLADNTRRNLAGMDARWLSTPNAWDPREESVAQWTAEHEHEGVFHDDVEPVSTLSIRNKQERRRALRHVYGDAVSGTRNGVAGAIKPWINLDRIDAEIVALLPRDPAQAERWFLNRKMAGEDAAFAKDAIEERADPKHVPEPHGLVTVGCDGARFADALALVATEVETGFQWPLGIWEKPEFAGDDYEHPLNEVDGALEDAFDQFDVWRVYIDPQWIDHLVERWQGRWGKDRVVAWYTNRPKQIAFSVRSFEDGVASGDWSHSGDETFVNHLRNARRRLVAVFDDQHRQMHTLSKDRPDSPRKIDAAMAAVLSWEARGDAIATGAKARSSQRAVGFA